MPLIDWELLLFDQRDVVSRQRALRYFSPGAIRRRLRTSRWPRSTEC